MKENLLCSIISSGSMIFFNFLAEKENFKVLSKWKWLCFEIVNELFLETIEVYAVCSSNAI